MAHDVRVDGLCKSYNGAPVLGPVDLQLDAGTITVVIGRSGCGKTTLLRCLGGLERPDSGVIRVGHGTLQPENIGYVFQEPRLMPWLTVAANIGFGLARRDRAVRDKAVGEALLRIGMPGAGDLLPKQLSGGMAQRVALARGLAAEPEVLLLDEPFSALDPFTREQMQDHLLHLHRCYGTTIVLITHDMDEALTLADRIVVLRGRPGLVNADLAISLPRPRLRTHEEVLAWRAQLAARLSER
jgi:sulfonate transport system ATP-binding protein